VLALFRGIEDMNFMARNGRLFCSKPFEWFEVTQLNGMGGVYLCCPSWLDTPVGNLQYQSVDEIWNSPKAQEIRRSILDGSFAYCNRSRCPYLQTKSGPVEKVEAVKDKDLRAVIYQNLIILPYGPKKIVCVYDVSCNLSCPSCRTHLIVESTNKREILNIQDKLQNEALKEAAYLHISGTGDPFGSPFYRKWLQTMRRQDMPKMEHIFLHSNGQLWTPKMWASISKNIQQLVRSAEISIDAATAETYAINRRGGKFEILIENLKFISMLRKNGPLKYLKISMVVQENNFQEMPDLVRLGQQLNVDVVYFSQLVNWGTFSDKEFGDRAVHFPAHPRHNEFVDLLQDKIFDDSVVDLGNLTDIRNSVQHPDHYVTRFTKKMWAKVKTYF
jgi:organic radical activating enzyme